jgi:hypothetical protein
MNTLLDYSIDSLPKDNSHIKRKHEEDQKPKTKKHKPEEDKNQPPNMNVDTSQVQCI